MVLTNNITNWHLAPLAAFTCLGFTRCYTN